MKAQGMKAARAALGLTQAEMAEKLGVTRESVARWETRFKIPTTVERLVELMVKEAMAK